VPDFSNPQDLNRYRCVRNRTLNAVDPDGHICVFGVGILGSCENEEDIGEKAALTVSNFFRGIVSNVSTAVGVTGSTVSGDRFGLYRTADPLPTGTRDFTAWLLDEMETSAGGDIAHILRGAN
jgi:hypothetical protein